jgi:uroporphyrinogen-III synthase
MRILVTRPDAEADDFQNALVARGHHVVNAPLLRMTPRAVDLDPTGLQGVIVTSRNALRALAGQPVLAKLLSLPCYAVGPGTGQSARSAGFRSVVEGPAGASDLIPVIARAADPKRGALLYLTGETIATDISEALAGHGFEVRRTIAYDMTEATAFGKDAATAFASGALDAVILMSPRTATVFVSLVKAAGLEPQAVKLKVFCLSQAVAAPLSALAPASVVVAKRPNSEEILALIG